MDNLISRLSDELNAVANVLQSSGLDPRRLNEVYGWNLAAISKQQLAEIPIYLSRKVQAEISSEIGEDDQKRLTELIASLTSMRNNSIPNFIASPAAGLTAYLDTMSFVSGVLEEVFGWQKISDQNHIPKNIARRLQNQVQRLSQIDTEFSLLGDKVKAINEASEAADALPTTLSDLTNAQALTSQLAEQSRADGKKIEASLIEANSIIETLKEIHTRSDSLVKKSEEAFRITTAAGLAGSFHERARWLNWSIAAAIIVLLVALGSAIWINHDRLSVFKQMLDQPTVDGTKFSIQLIIIAVGLGAPIWLAWMATKQIGYRFRLAEDYEFKAAVAKAYEGYRKEAVSIDPKLAERLFESTMKRFDEHPLRLVERATAGSPLGEISRVGLLGWLGFGRSTPKPKPTEESTQA